LRLADKKQVRNTVHEAQNIAKMQGEKKLYNESLCTEKKKCADAVGSSTLN